uniref:Uncharacterized protein n=1 Tax=Arundo donax TaxID=35708 RepID=A0A0A9CCI2_ARUDO
MTNLLSCHLCEFTRPHNVFYCYPAFLISSICLECQM